MDDLRLFTLRRAWRAKRLVGAAAFVACALAVAASVCCGGSLPRPEPFVAAAPTAAAGARIVVVGDLQRTAPVLESFRESNDPERAVIVRAIADAHPDLLAITGDCVFDGGSDAQWAEFDALAAPLRRASIPAIMAFGNHEYWLGRPDAERHVFERFPLVAERHWYTFAVGPLRLVVLDGNEGQFNDIEWGLQRGWYEQTLAAFDRDADVRGVLVLLHQPPYTNSTVTGDETQVQRDFVPPLLHAKKTLAMLSGHVHSYERYAHEGKTFVVSGGGGGPRARLSTGGARRHPDDLFVGPELRDFNFTVYTVSADGVDAVVRGLPKGGTALRDMDHFVMRWPS